MLNLAPLHPHDLLAWMTIPTYPGVYVLGSFARHVTIYSQQMRAFNLIDALCKTGQLRPGAPVAVVGGGIAGLTAAAAAAVRGADVTIIESDKDFFPIQRHAGKRYLHPHIYDWPLYELDPDRENRADFPFLDWEADDAEIVFRKLRQKWDDLFNEHAEQLRRPNPLMGTRLTRLEAGPELGCVKLTVETNAPDGRGIPESKTFEAEIVILALGFGREFSGSDLQTYWEQAPFDAVPATKLRWLVSGYGDGGLTDLMRLCINDFRHDVFVKRYEKDPNVAVKLRKLLAARKNQTVRSVFEELYKQLDERSLIVESQLRSNTEVTFNAPAEYLEAEGSSILNKFLVFQLEKLGQFQQQQGWLKLPIPTPNRDRKYTVEFTDSDKKVIAKAEFDRLIVRHGPARPISEESFSEIWKATEELRNRWAAQSQSNDRTRVQIWNPADYTLSAAPNPILLADEVHEDVDLSCVIVESTNLREESTLANLVSTALNSHKKAIGLAMNPPRKEGNIKASFETIKINEALSGQKEYNRAVSLLCKADIAVIDVTRYEPGVMLLLGIRSAIKRGVTIVTTNLKLDSAEWSRLPFNLKELYPVSLRSEIKNITSPEHPNQVVGRTIARALGHYHSLPFYQDVPAYEAVRRFDPLPKEEAQLILWLCSFHPNYESYASYIQQGYMEAYGNDRNERDEYKYLLERITEIVSPQLVTQKLYSAIRRTALCLIDWTFWSPNVFFEFGVRLAVSNFGPICLLATNAPEIVIDKEDGTEKPIEITNEQKEQREKLKRLFPPLEYSLETDKQELFKEIRARHAAMLDHEAPGRRRPKIPPTFGAFSFDHTYKFVGGLLPLQNEPGAWSAHSYLTAAADSLIGVSSTTEPSLPVLYANVNNELDKQARTAAKEVLIAAWYYLSNRYRDKWQELGLQEEYKNLGIRLVNLLRESDDEMDQALHQSIRQDLKTLKSK